MKLTDLKINDCIKHNNADYFLELIQISGDIPNRFYVFEKLSVDNNLKLKCQYRYNDDSLFDNFHTVKKIPEEYLHF